MGRKKKKTRRNIVTIAPERLAELVEQFDQGALESVGDDEMVAMCDLFEKGAQVDALLHMIEIAASNKQQKSVKRSLFRLNQRGHVVPDMRERSPGIRIAPLDDETVDLPVAVHEPFSEGSRYFFLPYQSGGRLLMLQAKFEEPLGLKELKAGDVSRSQYRSTMKKMFAAFALEEEPVMVEADSALCDRKLWEIGHCIRTGRTGPDVDSNLCSELRWPDSEPPHPVESLDLDDVEPMTHAELNEATRLITPVYSQTHWEEMSQQIEAVTDSPLILSEMTEAERVREVQQKVVGKWLERWDDVAFNEIFLDTGLFRALSGNRSAARLFRDVVAGVEGEARRDRIAAFLERLVAQMFDEQPEESDGSDEPNPSGIIIP